MLSKDNFVYIEDARAACEMYGLGQARLTATITMNNITSIPADTEVLVWMASRFGDIGIAVPEFDETTSGYTHRIDAGFLKNLKVRPWSGGEDIYLNGISTVSSKHE